jgi:hypothetical protein
VLTSASNGERPAADGSLGDDVTLAVRANATTDIWNPRGGSYPSRPFRTADPGAVRPFCDLVLYSMTFNNDLDHDLANPRDVPGSVPLDVAPPAIARHCSSIEAHHPAEV